MTSNSRDSSPLAYYFFDVLFAVTVVVSEGPYYCDWTTAVASFIVHSGYFVSKFPAVFLKNFYLSVHQAPQLYAPHPAGYPQVSPPSSLQYVNDPGATAVVSVLSNTAKTSNSVSPEFQTPTTTTTKTGEVKVLGKGMKHSFEFFE